MERQFHLELDNLNGELLRMGSLVEMMIATAVKALKEQDQELARSVIEKDTEVDQQELLVHALCLRLLALRQPLAKDLRLITAGMMMATDLERMGDLAVDIAERALEVADLPPLKPLVDIPRMADIATKMLRDVLHAFIQRDVARARAVYQDENEEDRLRDCVHQELVAMMTADGSLASRTIPLLLASRHLERICDHATNIAEDILFIVDGEVARHHPRMLGPDP